MPVVQLAPPSVKRVLYLKSLMPHVYSSKPMKPMQKTTYRSDFLKQLKEFEPGLIVADHGRMETIGRKIEFHIFPDRVEIIIRPGVDRSSVHELASKVFRHIKSLHKGVKIALYRKLKGKKRRLLLDKADLRKYTREHFKHYRDKELPAKMRTAKHYLLGMSNAIGGALFGSAIHHRLFRNYYVH